MGILRALRVAASGLALTMAVAAAPSSAAVVYTFTTDNSNISLTYDDFVTEPGLKPLDASYPTPFGYNVNFAGTNRLGW